MKYRTDKKSGNQLSALGFGCLRFPQSLDKTEKLILRAVADGVNFFDTAYIYSESEEKLGTILARNNLRDKVYLSTKLPLANIYKYEDFDTFFNIQLRRLKTDYVDYYLMHMLNDLKKWNKLRELGIERWIQEKKEEGKIRHIGFSSHGSRHDFLAVLDSYEWEFCLIQYNYYDENNQAGVEGLKRAAEKGLSVFIMEPLLGGKLAANLPSKVANAFKKYDPQLSPAAWALNWLWNQPEVTMVLSGMNEEFQLEDNLAVAAKAEPFMLSESQMAVYAEATAAFKESYRVSCTGCNYCMPCPKNVNIPACFSAYNTSYAIGYITGIKHYVLGAGLSTEQATASRCIGCGKCEKACPQKIEIRKKLKSVSRRLEPFWCKIGIKIVRRIFGKSKKKK